MREKLLALMLVLSPNVVWAQTTDENQDELIQAVVSSVYDMANEKNVVVKTTQDQPEATRRVREIKNREFDDRQKIELLLSAHCGFPSKEDLLSTSPDAEKHIQDIINDDNVLGSVRERALRALAYFTTPGNEASLKEILERGYSTNNRIAVMYALNAYSNVAGDRAAPVIARFLEHPDEYIRLVAIRNLKATPGEASLKALQDRRRVEENRFFQTKLDQAIAGHCNKRVRCDETRR